MYKKGMVSGLKDKNGKNIRVGDKVRLVLSDGEVRDFLVEYKTVGRTVKNHPDFDEQYEKVNITGVVFTWNGYNLFPCVDSKWGNPDNEKMEILSD